MIQEEHNYQIIPINHKCSTIINKDYVENNPSSINASVQSSLTNNNNQAAANSQYDNVSDINIKPLYGGNKNKNKKLSKRHFKLVSLNGIIVDFKATSYILIGKSPSNAARKILTSIAHHKNFYGNNKIKLGVVLFIIRETTQGSKCKEYGPYSGKFKKYTKSEIKKSSYKVASGKTIIKTMKPIIHLDYKKK